MKKMFRVILLTIFLLLVIFILLKITEDKKDTPIELLVYRNERLGFEIQYPNKYHVSRSDFDLKDDGYDIYQGMVPIKMFEEDSSVYINDEYFIDCSDQYMTNDHYRYLKCEKIYTSLDHFEDREVWQIVVEDIYSEEELDAFVKERYGSTCNILNRESFHQDGVYQISSIGNERIEFDENCFVNYATILLYYPDKNKVATWDLGMEYSFWSDSDGTIKYDPLMISSFRFID